MQRNAVDPQFSPVRCYLRVDWKYAQARPLQARKRMERVSISGVVPADVELTIHRR